MIQWKREGRKESGGIIGMRLTDIGAIKELLARHGFTFSRSLGQNFLINPSVCPRIAELGGAAPGIGVLEIGPGIGVLTAELAKRADRVVSVELDDRLFPILEETLCDFGNVKLIHGDILKIDLKRLLAEEMSGLEIVVCANLPYYITSPVLMRLLEERLPVKAITVMVQKEAAVRLCAVPGTRECGAVSVAVRYYSTPRQLFSVSRGSFLPAPHVDSAVIRLDIGQSFSCGEDEPSFFRIVRACFSQRRKTAVNAVSSVLSLSKDAVSTAFNDIGLSLSARAEEIGMEQFAALAHTLGPLLNDSDRKRSAEQ